MLLWGLIADLNAPSAPLHAPKGTGRLVAEGVAFTPGEHSLSKTAYQILH